MVLGYNDGELYREWEQNSTSDDKPLFNVFLNYSTSKEAKIPKEERYFSKVLAYQDSSKNNKYKKRLAHKGKTMAKLIYADEQLGKFIKRLKHSKIYKNSIIVITGTRNDPTLDGSAPLEKYRVPLIISSPLLKMEGEFFNPTSHYDLSASLLRLLANNFNQDLDANQAWLSQGLLAKGDKQIPLYKSSGRQLGFVSDSIAVYQNTFYSLQHTEQPKEVPFRKAFGELLKKSNEFEAIAKYAMQENKVLPDSICYYPKNSNFTKAQLVWINSVFSGSNFDAAYTSAQQMAFDGDYQEADLLCNYILQKVPSHVDALLLKGRVQAWQKNFDDSLELLQRAMQQHPKYVDAYLAYLDVCFWSKKYDKALPILAKVKKYQLKSTELRPKLDRCLDKVLFEQTQQYSELNTAMNDW